VRGPVNLRFQGIEITFDCGCPSGEQNILSDGQFRRTLATNKCLRQTAYRFLSADTFAKIDAIQKISELLKTGEEPFSVRHVPFKIGLVGARPS
jgi:hypothetical protein